MLFKADMLNSVSGSNFRFDLDGTEVMKINTGGLVGINETSPSAQLVVKSGAIDRVPLIVDSLSTHNTNIAEFRVGGVSSPRAYIDINGHYWTNQGIINLTNTNNARVGVGTNGAVISRNVADANPALIVNLANAGATDDIIRFQKAGSTLSRVQNDGSINIPTGATYKINGVAHTHSIANITDITKVNVTTGTVTAFSVNNRATLATTTGEYHFYGTIWVEKISTSTTAILTIGIRSSSSVTSQLVAEFIASTDQTSDGATSYLVGDAPNIDTSLTVTGNKNAFNLATSGSATTGHYAISFSGFFRLSSAATISLAVNTNVASAYSISGGFVVITAK
jgi:hypothetical protein